MGTIERAFELAKRLASIPQIKSRLRDEGYEQVEAHLAGRKIKADLNKVLNRRRSKY